MLHDITRLAACLVACTIPALAAPALDPVQYYVNVRTDAYNYTGYPAGGTYKAPCDAANTTTCATITFGTAGAPSLSATITAYPNGSGLSTETKLTAQMSYFYEIVGPASTTPIPITLTTYDSYSTSNNSRFSSTSGAAVTRLDGVNVFGNPQAAYAQSTYQIAPGTSTITLYALPNVEYDISLIATLLDAYNNGVNGTDGAVTITVFIDPVLTFGPNFDSTGYSFAFSDGINNGDTPPPSTAVPEPATLTLIPAGLSALGLLRHLRNRQTPSQPRLRES